MAGGAGALRRGAPAPGRGRGDAARLRQRPAPAGTLGECRGDRPRAARLPRAAPLRGGAVATARCSGHRRAQARRAAILLGRAGRRRRDRRQPRRAARGSQAATAPATSAQARGGLGAAGLDRRGDAAGAARPCTVRARLRLRAAGCGAGRAGPLQRQLRRRGAARPRQGQPHARRAGRRARARGATPLPGACAPAAGARARGIDERHRRGARAGSAAVALGAAAVRLPTCAGACAPGRDASHSPAACLHTRCATPSLRTCWRAAPTCA